MIIHRCIASIFKLRQKQIDRYTQDTEKIQRGQLSKLLSFAQKTEIGRNHGFSKTMTYEEFSKSVPLITYEELKPYVERMHQGEQNLIWPTPIKWYAKSSGTTNDKSKYIPVSTQALRYCHYRGGRDCLVVYFGINPNTRIFSGKGLILGGSRSIEAFPDGSFCGDLSAILIKNIPSIANLIRTPKKSIALMPEWESKLEVMSQEVQNENVTNMSGVPSWYLVLVKKILAKKGVADLSQVWPNLEVFFHGGVAFTPYREQYKQLISNSNMHYVETYNASEGFFGIQNDLSDPSLLLMIDLGIFYEFIPMDEMEQQSSPPIPLWEIQLEKNYAMIITTNSGLWRYQIGDTIKFTSKNPYKFIISGRTKHFINAFGEELMIDNAEKALAEACKETGAMVSEYTAAPVLMTADHSKGYHQWLIEFSIPPTSMEQFADLLDNSLQKVNSDYEAKRYKNMVLGRLELIVAQSGLFHRWLKQNGKLGGQHKVPRLSNCRTHIDQLLELNQQENPV